MNYVTSTIFVLLFGTYALLFSESRPTRTAASTEIKRATCNKIKLDFADYALPKKSAKSIDEIARRSYKSDIFVELLKNINCIDSNAGLPDTLIVPPIDTFCARCITDSAAKREILSLISVQKNIYRLNPFREAPFSPAEIETISTRGINGSRIIISALQNLKIREDSCSCKLSEKFYRYFEATAKDMARYKQILQKGGLYASKTLATHEKVLALGNLELAISCLNSRNW